MSIIRHVLPRAPYFVRRTSRGALPVYSDACQVHIRHVQGRVSSLAQDLRQSLFDAGSPHAARLSVRVHPTHVVLSGGRFKRDVMAWLTAKGF